MRSIYIGLVEPDAARLCEYVTIKMKEEEEEKEKEKEKKGSAKNRRVYIPERERQKTKKLIKKIAAIHGGFNQPNRIYVIWSIHSIK